MKNQKLLDALKTVKKECLSHEGNCDECPLYEDKLYRICLITDRYPSEWHPWTWLNDHGSCE